MSCKVFARTGGWQFLSPDSTRMEHVEKGSTVIWQWPVVPEGHDDYDPDHKLPRGWKVLEELGHQGLAEALAQVAAERESVKDPYASRAKPRGKRSSQEVLDEGQGDLIRAAVSEMEPGNTEHYTGRGPTAKPRVEVVQQIVERIREEQSGQRVWPDWVNRKVIDAATAEGLATED